MPLWTSSRRLMSSTRCGDLPRARSLSDCLDPQTNEPPADLAGQYAIDKFPNSSRRPPLLTALFATSDCSPVASANEHTTRRDNFSSLFRRLARLFSHSFARSFFQELACQLACQLSTKTGDLSVGQRQHQLYSNNGGGCGVCCCCPPKRTDELEPERNGETGADE